MHTLALLGSFQNRVAQSKRHYKLYQVSVIVEEDRDPREDIHATHETLIAGFRKIVERFGDSEMRIYEENIY